MKKYFLVLFFFSASLFAQDSTAVKLMNNTEDSIAVDTINPNEGNRKGYYAFSVGMNFGQYTSKNEDAFIYYILDESSNSDQLTEEEQLTFPLLLGLLDTEKSMKSVEWLKSALVDEFNFSKEDLNPYPYFVLIFIFS